MAGDPESDGQSSPFFLARAEAPRTPQSSDNVSQNHPANKQSFTMGGGRVDTDEQNERAKYDDDDSRVVIRAQRKNSRRDYCRMTTDGRSSRKLEMMSTSSTTTPFTASADVETQMSLNAKRDYPFSVVNEATMYTSPENGDQTRTSTRVNTTTTTDPSRLPNGSPNTQHPSLSSTFFNEVMMRSVQKQAQPMNTSTCHLLENIHPNSSSMDDTDMHNNNSSSKQHGLEDTDCLAAKGGQPSTPQQPAVNRKRPRKAASHSDVTKSLPSPSNATAPAAPVRTLTTPAAKASTATTSNTLFTPEGFQMLKYINQAEDSPFQSNAPITQQQAQELQQQQEGKTRRKAQSEWHTLKLNTFGSHSKQRHCRKRLVLPFLDWSLKDHVTLELEGCPSGFSNKWLSTFLGRPSTILQQTRPHGYDGQAKTSKKHDQWAQSLLYWQYPAHDSTINRASSIPNKKVFSSRNDHNTNSMSTLRWGRDDKVASRNLSRSGGGLSKPISIRSRQSAEKLLRWKEEAVQQQQQQAMMVEWKDAFWSLYGNWFTECKQLVLDMKHDRIGHPTLEDVAQTSFYACGAGHSVLFRLSLRTQADDKMNEGRSSLRNTDCNAELFESSGADESDEEGSDKEETAPIDWECTPEVIFSSSSLETRTKLRQMGAKLRFLESVNGQECDDFVDEEAFWTNLELPSVAKGEMTATATSPSVQAELVALRRAQAMGQTIGADIMVKTKESNQQVGKRRPRPRHLPPLVVRGDTGCASFAELYLNVCGRLSCSQDLLGSSALPVLLCRRKLGPFLYSSMKQLRVQRLIRPGSQGLQVKGFILPCA